jgi:hypothetical protein
MITIYAGSPRGHAVQFLSANYRNLRVITKKAKKQGEPREFRRLIQKRYYEF